MNSFSCKKLSRSFHLQHVQLCLRSTYVGSRLHPRVTATGSGIFGALGRGDSLVDAEAYLTVNTPLDSSTIGVPISISAGWGHSAILTDRGRLLIFGRPYDFSILMQLNRLKAFAPNFARAIGKFTAYFTDVPNGLITTPQLVPNLDDVIACKCGAGLTVSLTRQGEVYAFGQNRWGQCGIGDDKRVHLYAPEKVLLPGKVTAVDAGLQHCVALTEGGEAVYTWGKGNRGQLGNNETDSYCTPVRVKFGSSASSIIGSSTSTLTPNSTSLASTTISNSSSTPPPTLTSKSAKTLLFADVSAGFNHTAALTADGAVYLWGKGMSEKMKTSDQRGIRGLRLYEDQMIPRLVEIPGGRRAAEICSSNFNLVMRCSDGSLWALGLGEYDRSTCAYPLRVQQAADEDRVGSDKDSGKNSGRIDSDKGSDRDSGKNSGRIDSDKGSDRSSDKDRSGKASYGSKSISDDDKRRDDADSTNNSGDEGSQQEEKGQVDAARAERRQREQKRDSTSTTTSTTTSISTVIPLDPPVTFPQSARLRKGFNRVAILSDVDSHAGLSMKSASVQGRSTSSSNSGSNGNSSQLAYGTAVFEVIVHAGEAYLKEKTLEIELDDDVSKPSNSSSESPNNNSDDNNKRSKLRILDFSSGWQHSLAIIQE